MLRYLLSRHALPALASAALVVDFDTRHRRDLAKGGIRPPSTQQPPPPTTTITTSSGLAKEYYPYRKLSVRVIKAVNIHGNDIFSKPDCYVQLNLPTASAKPVSTKIINNSSNPQWDETFFFQVHTALTNVLELTMYDADMMKDDIISKVLVDVESLKVGEKIHKNYILDKKAEALLEVELKLEESDSPECPVYTNGILSIRPCMELIVALQHVAEKGKQEREEEMQYLSVSVPPSYERERLTPCWSPLATALDENLTFHVDSGFQSAKLNVGLYKDQNISETFPEKSVLGTRSVPLTYKNPIENVGVPLPLGKDKETEVDLTLNYKSRGVPALRLGFDLSDGEKEFLQKRMKVMPAAFQKFLNLKATPHEKEVPVVAVLGSGGGMRATISLFGCLLALEEQGLLDCITYMIGVSGSTWCISNLYQQPLWGKGETSVIAQEIQELKACTIAPKYGAFSPEALLKFRNAMNHKKEDNQFVSLTDLWGLVLQWIFGKQEKLVRLSDQQKVVSTGQVPYPIYSAINVKSTVSTEDFAEWVEFTPHEVGIPKYGGFVRTADFGSEFYMGNLVRRHAELPLHYLQGLWGSAFAASLDRIYLDATGNGLKLLKSFKTKISTLDDKAPGRLATKIVTPVSWFSSTLGNIFTKHRAGQNFNFLSGCFLSRNYLTSSQFLTKDVTNFDSQPNRLTPLENDIFLVDAGLKMNSAFPLVMRPQRNVDVIISFDFSWQRPFTTLMLTSKYCQEHGIPFPKIDVPSCSLNDLHECYVFSDESDPRAPIVLHFPLINNSFRKFKAPGNPRVTEEECAFGDFDVYMSNSPYRTFNFTYSELEFDRLIALNHYNVANNLPAIRQALQSALKRTKRRVLPANSNI